MQGGKPSSPENICRMLSIPFPILMGYLDKLSSNGKQTASAMGGDLNDHSTKTSGSSSFHCY